jgi:hypothetical protein
MLFQKTKQIANQIRWTLTGFSDVCKAESLTKEHHCQGNKKVQFRTKWHNISSVQNHEYNDPTSKPYWTIIVNIRTQLKLSEFLYLIMEWLSLRVRWYNLKNSGKDISIIRCNDGGKNKARINSSDWKMGIKFQYTGYDTPQRNSVAKAAFQEELC